jgi:hypothetical protein
MPEMISEEYSTSSCIMKKKKVEKRVNENNGSMDF